MIKSINLILSSNINLYKENDQVVPYHVVLRGYAHFVNNFSVYNVEKLLLASPKRAA